MFRLLIFPTLIVVLAIPLATASEAVLMFPPFVIREKMPEANPLTTTEVGFTSDGADTTPEGLSERTANFFVASSGAHSFNDTFALRGLTNTPIFGEPAVTFYLDDIPLGGGFTTPDFFNGVTSASLNRGPGQNTVFGRAGSAGVVQLTTPEPGKDATGQLDFNAGNYSSRGLSATLESGRSGPVDAFASAQYNARDGYVYNQRLGEDVDHRESSAGLARFNFRPTTTIKLSLIAQAEHARDGEQPFVPLGGPLFTIKRTTQGETDFNTFNTGLTAAFSEPWGRLVATSSVNDWRLGPYRSVLAFGPAELLNDVHLTQRNYNQEIKLSSDDSGDFQWHSGLFFSDGSTDGAFTRAFGPFVSEDSSYTLSTRRFAAYGETSLKVLSSLALKAGLRIEDARKSMDSTEKVPAPEFFSVAGESTALLPKFEADYTAAQNIRLFGSAGSGFKPGGFSAFTGNRSLAAFGPEHTFALEGGISQTTPDKSLSWTARAFLYEIHGYQIERSFATGSTSDDYLVVNAPKARSTGAELEMVWRPCAGLSLSSDFGLTHVILREFQDPYTGQSFSGKPAPYVPRYDFGLRCEYLHPSGCFFIAKWSMNGRTYYTESEDMTFAQRSYGILGGRMGFSAQHWRVSVYAENILNQQYYSSISPGTMHGTPGAPRTQGVEIGLIF